jgi:hypothetical protein
MIVIAMLLSLAPFRFRNTATSLNSSRNVLRAMVRDSNSSHKNPQFLITQMQPCRARGRRAPQRPSPTPPLGSESDLTACLACSIGEAG